MDPRQLLCCFRCCPLATQGGVSNSFLIQWFDFLRSVVEMLRLIQLEVILVHLVAAFGYRGSPSNEQFAAEQAKAMQLCSFASFSQR